MKYHYLDIWDILRQAVICLLLLPKSLAFFRLAVIFSLVSLFKDFQFFASIASGPRMSFIRYAKPAASKPIADALKTWSSAIGIWWIPTKSIPYSRRNKLNNVKNLKITYRFFQWLIANSFFDGVYIIGHAFTQAFQTLEFFQIFFFFGTYFWGRFHWIQPFKFFFTIEFTCKKNI